MRVSDRNKPLADPPSKARAVGLALVGKSESDAPINNLDNDRLGTGSLAVSLFKFIHNKNTSTPLNIAITGAWGKGKSSVMAMLASLLQQHQYRCIWFNAWHYRSEETFLGAFLETLQKEALPPWHTLRGIQTHAKHAVQHLNGLHAHASRLNPVGHLYAQR